MLCQRGGGEKQLDVDNGDLLSTISLGGVHTPCVLAAPRSGG